MCGPQDLATMQQRSEQDPYVSELKLRLIEVWVWHGLQQTVIDE